MQTFNSFQELASANGTVVPTFCGASNAQPIMPVCATDNTRTGAPVATGTDNVVAHAVNNGEGGYYKISSHPHSQWYDSVTDVIVDLEKGWINPNEAMDIARTFGWDKNPVLHAAIDTAANNVSASDTTIDNSREGFDKILPKIMDFKRNPRHGEEKAVSGTLTRRVAAAIDEIMGIDDKSEQKACAKRLLDATAIVEGGTRHADDAIRASVPSVFDFNPYSDQAKRSMDRQGISYNERKYNESMAMIQSAVNRNNVSHNMKYADAIAVINDALDAMDQTDNVKNIRTVFNSLVE